MEGIRIDADAFYTVHTTALELGISKDAIKCGIREGALATVKRGHQRFITGQSIILWLKPSTNQADDYSSQAFAQVRHELNAIDARAGHAS